VAILLALMSSVVWGTSDFIGGVVSRRIPSYLVVAASQASGLIAVTVVAVSAGRFGEDRGWVAPAIVAGASLASGLVMFYAALASGAMGVVSPIAALGVLVPVGVGLVRGDSPSPTTSVGIVVALVGVVSASGPEFRGHAHGRSIVLACLSALCFGTAMLFLAMGATADPLMSLWGMRAISVTAVTTGILLVARPRRSSVVVRRSDVPLIFAIGVGDSAANLLFQLASLRGYLSVVSVLASLYPAMTVVLAWVILEQRLQRTQLIGIIAALAGIALVSIG